MELIEKDYAKNNRFLSPNDLKRYFKSLGYIKYNSKRGSGRNQHIIRNIDEFNIGAILGILKKKKIIRRYSNVNWESMIYIYEK